MKDLKLVVLDVDGVMREGSKLFYECHKEAMKIAGLEDEFKEFFNVKDLWHFKGLGKFNDKRKALEAIYVLIKSGKLKNIHKIIYLPDAEERITQLMGKDKCDNALLDTMVNEYRNVALSPNSKKLIKVYPGIRGILNKIKRHGKILAIFTNSNRITLERDLKPLLADFDYVVTPENIRISKPSGEGLVLISKMSGVKVQDMVYIGDTVVDIKSAKSAGCISAVVCTGMGLRQHLDRERPDYIFDDLNKATKWILEN